MINKLWFGIESNASHTIKGVPLSSQLWAFDQIPTRYVLQCDLDVLIGRQDIAHNYLADMLNALTTEGVLSVAFNIPHATGSVFIPFMAPPGGFVPEVRCGLLDLERVRACRPLPNSLEGGTFTLSWYRALQQYQLMHGLRTLRGGDPRTFYIHPQNSWKQNPTALARARDLTGQGKIPPVQFEQWDLAGSPDDWKYTARSEDIVFLIKGRDTDLERIKRCIASMIMQDDQRFDIVMIDDASVNQDVSLLPHLLGPLLPRTTLIRNPKNKGRIPNFRFAIQNICINPESLIVILDIDDALMSTSVVSRLRAKYEVGADVILAAMYRPNKPLKLYHPDFIRTRETWGGEVWIHLRSFRKRLFDAIPDDALKLDGTWIEHCTDYATMIPIVELCQRPFYIPEYLYFHERSTPHTAEMTKLKDSIIRGILAKQSLRCSTKS